MGNQEDMRNLLQEKFEYFEPEPDRDIWAGIEAGIRPVPIYRRIAWHWYAVAAVILLLLAVGIGLMERQALVPGNPSQELATSPQLEEQETPVPDSERFVEAEVEKNLKPENTVQQPQSVTTPQQQAEQPVIQLAATDGEEDTMGNDSLFQEEVQPALKPERKLVALQQPQLHPDLLETESAMEHATTLTNVPVASAENQQMSSTRKRIDISELSLNNALVMAGDGIRNLTQKPSTVSHSEDGTETTKTYRINFLDISFSKKRHTIKSKKEKS